MITLRTRDNLHKARERLQPLLIFVVEISGKAAHSMHPKVDLLLLRNVWKKGVGWN